MSLYRWQLQNGDWEQANHLARELGITRPIAHLLALRGYTDSQTAYDFLNPSLDQLADPLLLPDARPAVNRLMQAIENKETILISGDYDVDGVTSTALWVRMFQKLQVKVHWFIPDRAREGYDFHLNAVERANDLDASLIVTCDCGTRAHDVVDHAREKGIDVIITDHHEPGEELPPAVAIVNPHREGSEYPFPQLAGVGVSFRLGEALVREKGIPVNNYRQMFLDLVALGTIADVMPLVGENRAMIVEGLKLLGETKKVGLQQLFEVANVPKIITPYHVGFQLGPRLNAAGRLEHAQAALKLLLAEDPAESRRLAENLDQMNRERQALQDGIIRDAIAQIETRQLTRHKAFFLCSEDWHAGIIGIVAGRLMNRYHRPVFMVHCDKEAGQGKGSIRSIRGFDLRPLLAHVAPLCIKSGGHELAGGFSAELDRLQDLEEAIYEYADTTLSDEDLQPVMNVDLAMPDCDVNAKFVDELHQLAPFGHGNQTPVLLCRGVMIYSCKATRDGKHLQITVKGEGGGFTGAVAFGMGDQIEHFQRGAKMDVVFTPERDTYRNDGSIQWQIKDYDVIPR